MKFIYLLSFLLVSTTMAETVTFFIGTGGKNAEGIYRTTLDTESGKLTEPELAAEIGSPGFVVLNADKTRLYSICNIEGGSVAAYAIGVNGKLTLLNHKPIGDGGAAHLCLDNEGKMLFTAQYGAGSVAAFPLNEDGSIGDRSDLEKHSGSGPNPDRQKGPHPHSVVVSPDNRFLFVPDLGIDKVMIYKVEHDSATISPHGHGTGVPGGGPRHMKFSKDGTKIYLLNEMLLSVTVFDYDAETAEMKEIQTIDTLPEEKKEIPNKAAEIRVHPSGKFVYASNRGHDSITAFSVDGETGKLTLVERETIRGSWPRNFNLDPSGNWLIAAGRYSNTLSVFEVDNDTGGLKFSGNVVNCPSPICVEH